jgi:hypothetical protein
MARGLDCIVDDVPRGIHLLTAIILTPVIAAHQSSLRDGQAAIYAARRKSDLLGRIELSLINTS